MEKLLLFSLLVLSISFSKCNNKKDDNSKVETQKIDFVHIHKAPNQDEIDSIKFLKTEKKLKKEKGNNQDDLPPRLRTVKLEY